MSTYIPYIEIIDNIPGVGWNLDDEWNNTYQGCECTTEQAGCCHLPTISKNVDAIKSGSESGNHQNNINYNNALSLPSNLSGFCICMHSAAKTTASAKNIIYYYKQNRRLDLDAYADLSLLPPIIECSDNCTCKIDACINRVVQLGPQYELEIFDCEEKAKGKGVRVKEVIMRGSFVAEYLGELIESSRHAEELFQRRSQLGEPNYIMHLREFDSNGVQLKSTIIDARNYSNVARFINHSCEPNLVVIPVRIGNFIPHAALFSLRDIQTGEELSYNYNSFHAQQTFDINENTKNNDKIPCLCGTPKCLGFLPKKFK